MSRPFVSVLVPVRNEERHIEACLYSLAAQDYPRERFEVLVIDGASTDGTPQLVLRFAAESLLDLRLLQNPHARTAPGLNAGLRASRGDVVVRVDGHASVAPDFLRRSVDGLEATGADCVGGVIESRGDGATGEAIAVAMSSRFGVGGGAFRIGGEGPVDTVAFGAYRREVFERIGAFAEDIDKGEDDEFNYRLLDAGGSILLVPSIRASYTVRDSLPGLARQYFAYGRAKVEVLHRHPRQARPRQFAPAVFVAILAAGIVTAPSTKSLGLKRLVTVYAVAATIVSSAQCVQRGWRLLPQLLAAYPCLHVSYGLGTITGLLGLVGRTLARTAASDVREGTEAPKER